MAHRLKAQTHVNFNNDLHEQVIPEEGTVVYSNTYVPSSSDSSSSMDEDEQRSDHEGKFRYPQELLGMSWGSYLHSGPPTRVQTSTKAKGSVAVNDPLMKHTTVVTDSPANLNAGPIQSGTEVHGLLRTKQVPVNDDEGTAQAINKNPQHPAKTVKLVCKVDNSESKYSQLHQKLRSLVNSLSDCNAELERYGLESIPMEPSSSLLSRVERDGLPEDDNNKEFGSLQSDKLIHDVIDYLGEMVKRLVKQGRKLNEQALFLQRTGKQLGRNQQSFMEEQALLTQAAEKAQEQLMIEKVTLKGII